MKDFRFKVINVDEQVFFIYEHKHTHIRTALYNIGEIIHRKNWKNFSIVFEVKP